MAQTKTKAKPRSRKESASKSTRSSSKSKASKTKSRSTSTRSRNGASASKASSKSRSRKSSPSNGSSSKGSNVEAVRNAVGDVGGKAKSAGKTVGKAASKAKVPLVAGGAALAGGAGGLALAASHSKKGKLGTAMKRRPKVKFNSKDVAKAAKEVGNFSTQMGELASELQRARESADGRRRSPVEVVLQGLTARR